MTTKQIAESVSKSKKTVRTWAKKASAKTAAMTAKLAVANSTHPVEWDIEETISISEGQIETLLAIAIDLYKSQA